VPRSCRSSSLSFGPLAKNGLDARDALARLTMLIRLRALPCNRLHAQVELLATQLEQLFVELFVRHRSQLFRVHLETRLSPPAARRSSCRPAASPRPARTPRGRPARARPRSRRAGGPAESARPSTRRCPCPCPGEPRAASS